jgi:hypothetical protein
MNIEKGNIDRLAGIDIYVYRNKTFDVFVMILCVLDLLMPVGDIQAEKMGVQSIFNLLLILFKIIFINSHDVLMLHHVLLLEKYINHFEYPFPKQMFHPAM